MPALVEGSGVANARRVLAESIWQTAITAARKRA